MHIPSASFLLEFIKILRSLRHCSIGCRGTKSMTCEFAKTKVINDKAERRKEEEERPDTWICAQITLNTITNKLFD